MVAKATEVGAAARAGDAPDVLRAARDLLADAGWCQHAEARDARGHPVYPMAAEACAFSASGAIYRASTFDGTPERRQLYERAVALLGEEAKTAPTAWNDSAGRTRTDVVTAFDRALARIQAQVPSARR
jgi:hypothetical protein